MYIKIDQNKKSVDRQGLISFHDNFYKTCLDLTYSEKIKVLELFLGNVFQELGFITVDEGKWFKEQYLISYTSEEHIIILSISYEWDEKVSYILPSSVDLLCLGDFMKVSCNGMREDSKKDITLEILLDRVIKDLRNIWTKFVLKQELSDEDSILI